MNWIRVEDRLPEQKYICGTDAKISRSLVIWVVDPSGHYGERYMNRHYCDDEFQHINEDHIVTHWMLEKDFKEEIKPLNTNSK